MVVEICFSILGVAMIYLRYYCLYEYSRAFKPEAHEDCSTNQLSIHGVALMPNQVNGSMAISPLRHSTRICQTYV